MITVEFVTRSHVGMMRARNEDVVGVDARHGWAVLADGMGGYRGGEIAARIAVETIQRGLTRSFLPGWSVQEASQALTHAVESANTEIYRAGQQNADLSLMGSTVVVVAVLEEGTAVCVHVGDSRAYRLREGVLQQLTRDHTVLQEQVDAGLLSAEEARVSNARGMLTRGLGVASLVDVDLGVIEMNPDDLLLLCSDGLTDMLPDSAIRDQLVVGKALDEIADALVAEANQRGGRDNVSVVLARLVV